MSDSNISEGSEHPEGYETPDGELRVSGGVYHETELGQHQRWLRQSPDLFEKYQTLLDKLVQIAQQDEARDTSPGVDRAPWCHDCGATLRCVTPACVERGARLDALARQFSFGDLSVSLEALRHEGVVKGDDLEPVRDVALAPYCPACGAETVMDSKRNVVVCPSCMRPDA